MPREKPDYREHRAEIAAIYGDRMMLSFDEVVHLIGRDRRTVKKWLAKRGLEMRRGDTVSCATLARVMCD